MLWDFFVTPAAGSKAEVLYCNYSLRRVLLSLMMATWRVRCVLRSLALPCAVSVDVFWLYRNYCRVSVAVRDFSLGTSLRDHGWIMGGQLMCEYNTRTNTHMCILRESTHVYIMCEYNTSTHHMYLHNNTNTHTYVYTHPSLNVSKDELTGCQGTQKV